MKFGNIGFIKIYFYQDLSISGLTVKRKLYRRPARTSGP